MLSPIRLTLAIRVDRLFLSTQGRGNKGRGAVVLRLMAT